MLNNNKKLKKVEKLLNVTQDAIDDMQIIQPTSYDVDTIEDLDDSQMAIFEVNELRKTFVLVKQNLTSMVNSGQNLYNQIDGLLIDDLKASEVSAIAQLGDSIARQLKIMIEIYKDISDIEQSRKSTIPNNLPPGSNVTQNTQNIVVQGSTKDMLEQISKTLG